MTNTPLIETDRLILRKFTEDDLNDYHELLVDKEVNQFLPWFASKTLEDTRKRLREWFLDYYELEFAFRYAVCLKENNRVVGYVWLSNGDSNDFGYGLKKEHWNQGLITEASREIIKEIKKTGLPFITATHDRENVASGRIMKKLGMEYKYTYEELWEPKKLKVFFRMYQLNFDHNVETYSWYKKHFPNNFVEDKIKE